ncbi:hypothetical protein QBZ16_000528 [Prototheca wickerhamii]|uniref:NUC153 domain-containing protein n=1 Tax=Prototheca wickerhamii TaxID=3111 RepID=A0AAD9ILA9_PROWI|nr:hypothetical protein QBZ16_000528 [Prototheca wickerhamii]
MSISVAAPDGVKVYTVAGGKNLPNWAAKKQQKSLKKDDDYQRRVELLQEFAFPSVCQKIKVTPDEQYLFATGLHAPRVRVYDVSQLSLKFERHFDAEIVDFQVLSQDYSKAVFLGFDRTLDFHARFGTYHKTRIPRAGRALAYTSPRAELYVGGSAPELWRLSLEEGRFMAPLPCQSPAVNALGVSPAHGLLAAAGEEGLLESRWARPRAGSPSSTCAPRALTVKDHHYDAPIQSLRWLPAPPGVARRQGPQIVSSDRHVIRVWDAASGAGTANIEPREAGDINDVCELEERATPTVYDDYRFVTRTELDALGLAHLAGTSLLKPYMHGFFLDNRLYSRAKAIAEPFAYEAYRAKRAPKVNAALAARLESADGDAKADRRAKPAADGDDNVSEPALLQDSRFKALFEDEAFAVDERSEDYKALHPSAPSGARARKLVEEHFDVVEDDEDEEIGRVAGDKAAAARPAARAKPSSAAPRMYEARSETAAAAFRSGRSLEDEKQRPLAERVAAAGGKAGVQPRRRPVGNREVTFELKQGGKKRRAG